MAVVESDRFQVTESEGRERWCAHGSDVASQLESWSEILENTHLHFDVRPTQRTPGRFSGVVLRRSIDDIILLDSVAMPFVGLRDCAVIGSSGPVEREDIVGFSFLHRGIEVARGTNGRVTTMRAGDTVVWDGRQPVEIEIVEPFHKRTLLFPRKRVVAVCPQLEQLNSPPVLDGGGPARLLVRYMNALALELPHLGPAAAVCAANVALELLRAALEPELPLGRAAERAALRAEIRRHVRAHLHEADLGPTTVAREFKMSVRALHALFQDTDESVASMVRSERLERCHKDLQRANSGSVSDIALRWGFCDPTHFSRVFKQTFGVTPREIRQTAGTQA